MNNIKNPIGSIAYYFCAVVSSLLFANASLAQQAVILNQQSSIQTIAGELKIVRDPDGTKQVLLGKVRINEAEDDFVDIRKKFSMNGNDVVLMSNQCGGSGCSFKSWFFLTITPNGKVSVSPQMVGADNENATVEVDKEKIIVKVIARDGRRKKTTTWIYANGTAKVSP
jgi:hypothetical protein